MKLGGFKGEAFDAASSSGSDGGKVCHPKRVRYRASYESGGVPISTPMSVVSVLALAGGLADAADRHITIERHSDPTQKVSYYLSNNSDDALNSDVLVYPGDTALCRRLPWSMCWAMSESPAGFP